MPSSRRLLPLTIILVSVASAILLASCREREPVISGSTSSSLARNAARPTTAATQPSVNLTEPETEQKQFFSFAAASPNESDVAAGSKSCVVCHTPDKHSMHESEQAVSCAGCHGGHAEAAVPRNALMLDRKSPAFLTAKRAAHVTPKKPELWKTSANPATSGAQTIQETADFIRFVNPGDLRAAMVACGACHLDQVKKVRTSMMAHGGMLWSAALYNNGAINRKGAVFGEVYTPDGRPTKILQSPQPTTREADSQGILQALWPLPRWEISQPGNVLRVFEQGGKFRPVLGIPDNKEDPGRPDVKLSVRGFGTDVRTDPVFIGLQKTRLLDPTLSLIGTNDHPGDYRASGCSACHVVYANDRSSVHSASYAKFGNRGESFSIDPMVNAPRKGMPTTQPLGDAWDESRLTGERGHPIAHTMVRNPPTSTCISCHIHPGTNVVNAYLGFQWWDNETDGRSMYPRRQQRPDSDTQARIAMKNPEGAAARGLWSNEYPNEADHEGRVAGPDFLERIGTLEFNQRLTRTQLADFHGHGWVFRAVFKQDRHGNLLDAYDDPIPKEILNDPKLMNAAMAAAVKLNDPDSTKPAQPATPVHLKDIHLQRGMQCVDCHFGEDTHGNGNLYGETRSATHITCEDCHGDSKGPGGIFKYVASGGGDATLLSTVFTGNAAAKPLADSQKTARDVTLKRFEIDYSTPAPRMLQKSTSDPNVKWPVVQFRETSDVQSWWAKETKSRAPSTKPSAKPKASRGELARYAHTILKDQTLPSGDDLTSGVDSRSGKPLDFAHANSRVSCYACHTSWNTSCFGCHLPMKANQKSPMLHNEGLVTRNYTNYNFQTLRDDVFMLGIDSTAKDHKIVPIRSACAVLVSSQDSNRQWLYQQQQTVSAEGYAGTSFSPYFPHTVRATETKHCTDCHVSGANDNNAVMAQLMLQGTNSVNFIGRFAWVGLGSGGLEAVAVTEREEPQAVIGSTLHELAYPDDFRKHVEGRKRELTESHEHHGEVLDLQLRGEYVYAACGKDGFIAYDVANIDNKGFSEPIVTAPVSPLGQRFYVKSKYATSICSPSTLAIDPTRSPLQVTQKLTDGSTRTVMPNEEGKVTVVGDPSKVIEEHRGIHPLYAYLYMTDREEGLIVIGNPPDSPNKPGVSTLLDGNPQNNFLQRAIPAFNPNGLLNGARHIALHGTLAYISCEAGIVVVDLNDPLVPKIVATLSGPDINHPRKIAFQFRYGFVCDAEGIKVLDVTDPRRPMVVKERAGRPILVPLADARDIYVSRTYGYVAAGKDGLVILDLERPAQPRRVQYVNDFNAAAGLNDTTCVRIGMTNASMFAYVADGRNGLKILQLTSPEWSATYLGFSPLPQPKLIAWHKTSEPAIALSEGLDRDRAVDEAGNQLSVFGRRGARPFTLEEMQRLYLRNGALYTVSDDPPAIREAAAGSVSNHAAPPPDSASPPKRPAKLPFGPKR